MFRLNTDGSGYRLLHSFGNGNDGKVPRGALLEGRDGALYGVTLTFESGGTVFRLNKDGSDYRVLLKIWATSALIQGSDGALYGTTFYPGSVFKLNTDGSGFQTLRVLGSGGELGSFHSVLVEGPDGALYGTGISPPDAPYGGVFRLAKEGTGYTLLHRFRGGDDGWFPNSGLVLGHDGAFYGSTGADSYSGGTLFKLWPPETPAMIRVTAANNSVQISLAGEGGFRYQVLRSTDFATWSVLDTITMPATGSYIYEDTAPPRSAAYYRAAWVP